MKSFYFGLKYSNQSALVTTNANKVYTVDDLNFSWLLELRCPRPGFIPVPVPVLLLFSLSPFRLFSLPLSRFYPIPACTHAQMFIIHLSMSSSTYPRLRKVEICKIESRNAPPLDTMLLYNPHITRWGLVGTKFS